MSNQSITQFIIQYPPNKLSSPSILSTHLLKLLSLLSQSAPFYQYLLYKHLLTIPSLVAYNRNDCIRIVEHMRKESLSAESREIAKRVLDILDERFFPHHTESKKSTSEIINTNKSNSLDEMSSDSNINTFSSVSNYDEIQNSSKEIKIKQQDYLFYNNERKLKYTTPNGVENLLEELQLHSESKYPSFANVIKMQIDDRNKIEILSTLSSMVQIRDSTFKKSILKDEEFVKYCEHLYFDKNPEFVILSLKIMIPVLKYYFEDYSNSYNSISTNDEMVDIQENFNIDCKNLELIPRALIISISHFLDDKHILMKLCKISKIFIKLFSNTCSNCNIIPILICKLIGRNDLGINARKCLSTCLNKITPWDYQSFTKFSELLFTYLENSFNRIDTQNQNGTLNEYNDKNNIETLENISSSLISSMIIKIANFYHANEMELERLKKVISHQQKMGYYWSLYKISILTMQYGLFDLALHSLNCIINSSISVKTYYWLLHLKQWCEAEMIIKFNSQNNNNIQYLTDQQSIFISSRSSLFMCSEIDRNYSFQKYFIQLRISFSEILDRIQLLLQRITFPNNISSMISVDLFIKKFEYPIVEVQNALNELVNFSQAISFSFITIDHQSHELLQIFSNLCSQLRTFFGCLLLGKPYLQGNFFQLDKLENKKRSNRIIQTIHQILIQLEKNPSSSLNDRIDALKEVIKQCIAIPFEIPPYYFRVSKSFQLEVEIHFGKKTCQSQEVLTIDNNDAIPIRVFGQIKYLNVNDRCIRNSKYARTIVRCQNQNEVVATYAAKSRCDKDSFQAEYLIQLPQDRDRFVLSIETQIIDSKDNTWDFIYSKKPFEVKIERVT